MTTTDCSKISPTALFVAHIRGMVPGIPWAADIARLSNAAEAFNSIVGPDYKSINWLPAVIEARFKAINEVLHVWRITDLLELASGISPRGLVWTENPDRTYVETDLPAMLSQKRGIVETLLDNKGIFRPNLCFAEADALNKNDLDRASEMLPSGAIGIVSEGLMPYLSREEQRKLCRNIFTVLSRKGGLYVTPDVMTRAGFKKDIADPVLRKIVDSISGMTSRSFEENCFEDDDEAVKFFRSIGFTVHFHSFSSILTFSGLTSVSELGADLTTVSRTLEGQKVWVLQVR